MGKPSVIFIAEGNGKRQSSKLRLSFFIALGIGFQNLTEGMFFAIIMGNVKNIENPIIADKRSVINSLYIVRKSLHYI